MRPDSGFYPHAIVAVCRRIKVRFSITVRLHQSLRGIIEAIPADQLRPIPYWMDGAADVAEISYTSFKNEPGAAPEMLVVRRVKPTPDSQLALFARYSYRAFITDWEGDTLDLEAGDCRHTEIENAIRDLKHGVVLNHLPSGYFAATPELVEGCLLAVQIVAHTLVRWTGRIARDEPLATTKTLRGRFFSLAGHLTARHAGSPCTSPRVYLGKPGSVAPWRSFVPCHYRADGAVGVWPVPQASLLSGIHAPRWDHGGSRCHPLRRFLTLLHCGLPSNSAAHVCYNLHPARSLGTRALRWFSLATQHRLASLALSLRWIRV